MKERRRSTPATTAAQLVAKLEAAGRKVARIKLDGDAVEIVLDTGEARQAGFDDVDFSR